MRSIAPLVALLGLVSLTACEDDDPLRPTVDSGTGADAGPPDVSVPTYYGDVRPILVEQCTTCHTAGGIAPFAIETYAQAFDVGQRIAEVTAARIMPPFLADASGECNTYRNHRGLTDDEIGLIGDWVATGMTEGDPTTPAPTPAELPSLPRTDLTLEMPAEYTIDGSTDDDYHCFVVDPGLAANIFVTGYDVHPGNAQRVHHVITYNPTSQAAADQAVALDMQDGVAGDGYPCFGDARVQALPLTLWAPGSGAVGFPRGTGIEVTAGRPLIVQVHYNNLAPDSPGTDLTTIDLMTSDSVTPASFILFGDFQLAIPPRTASHDETGSVPVSFYWDALGSIPVDTLHLYGVLPHMHTLGRSLNANLSGPMGDRCLVEVPRWDFNWQLAYWYDEPIPVQRADTASVSCNFNSMSRDSVTNFGDGTQDEMCLAFVYVSL